MFTSNRAVPRLPFSGKSAVDSGYEEKRPPHHVLCLGRCRHADAPESPEAQKKPSGKEPTRGALGYIALNVCIGLFGMIVAVVAWIGLREVDLQSSILPRD